VRRRGTIPPRAVFVSTAAIAETKKFAQLGSPSAAKRKAYPVADTGQIAL
jgi:hypothetical protein